jgi:2-methylcitrate dehydratase PrpD
MSRNESSKPPSQDGTTVPTDAMNPSRRRLLQGAGGFLAVTAFPAAGQAIALPLVQAGAERDASPQDLTGRVASYMADARNRDLPPPVVREAKHRILDTLAAMVSGARLKPGEMAIRYVRAQGGVPEASIFTTNIRTSAVNAALANAMFGHADETDDVEIVTKAHPGCAVVPAALAVGERDDRSGAELLRAVTLGYDICCRWLMALGPDHVRATHRAAEGVGATFGATAAAASMARLSERGMRFALSYAAQQVSGVWSWERDLEHVEKAFDFAGMGARNGVTAALMVESGFTGVPNVLEGEHNALEAHSTRPHPEEMISGLGTRFWIAESAIKTFSVGFPAQSALDAFLALRREHGLTAGNVDRLVVRLPTDGAAIVNDRSMPDVNCQYLIAVALIDGGLSFDASHSYERMKDPQVLAVKARVELVADQTLMDPSAPRSARVEATLRDGRRVSHFTRYAPGTKENPLDTPQVWAKARDLMTPVLGAQRTEALIRHVDTLEQLESVRELIPLLAG